MKQNKYSVKSIISACSVLETNVSETEVFDYLRIVSLGKEIEENAKNILFFPIHFTDYDIRDGWVIQPLDLRKKILQIMENHPDYTYVIEPEMKAQIDKSKYKYILVPDLLETINELYVSQLAKVNPKVVALTGSVGKTTAVGLIEKVLKKKYSTLRIYHKRITPHLLKADIINFLTEDIEYVTLEMSLYYQDHVKVLSDLIPPTIAVFLDQDSSHLYKDGMNNIESLTKSKANIFKNANIGLYNASDNYISQLNIKDEMMYFNSELLFNTNLKIFQDFSNLARFDNGSLFIQGQAVKPYISSELSKLQYSLAYLIGKIVGVEQKEILDALNNYIPVENRLQKTNIFGKDVFFDGDVTTYERLKQLSKNLYSSSILIIRKFGSAENAVRFENVVELLPNFKHIYVFQDIEYIDIFRNNPNVTFVADYNFMKECQAEVIFYHYSGYFRDYQDIDEKNLYEIEQDNYKILPQPEPNIKIK